MTQDPLGFDAGDCNLYRYVNDRPNSAIDPSGTFEFTFTPGEVGIATLGNKSVYSWVTLNIKIGFVFYPRTEWDQAYKDRFTAAFKSRVERIWNARNTFRNIYITSPDDNVVWKSATKIGPVRTMNVHRWIPELEVSIVSEKNADYVLKALRQPKEPANEEFQGEVSYRFGWPVPVGLHKIVGDLPEYCVWYNGGKTAAHEVGHLLGLKHPFEEGKGNDFSALMQGGYHNYGTGLRPYYFGRWAKALNDHFGRNNYEPEWRLN